MLTKEQQDRLDWLERAESDDPKRAKVIEMERDQLRAERDMPGIRCSSCNGSGQVANPNHGTCDSPWETCERCRGAGRIQ